MSAIYLLILGSMVLLGATAVLGLFWAARNGQFRDMKRGARVIFDEEEPVGMPTDVVFKKREPRRRKAAAHP